MSKSTSRFFSVLCCLLLILPLAACDGKAKQTSTAQPSSTTNSTESSSPSAPDVESTPKGSDLQPSAPAETSSETSSETISTPNQAPPTVQAPPPISSMPQVQPPTSNMSETEPKEDESVKNIQVTVENRTFTATLAENAAAQEFVELMKTAPIVISMSDHGGFEKVGGLGSNLSTSNNNTTTQSGDIVLYNGNQLVVFYGSNTWSYTRLGKIDDLSGWEEALGGGDVTVTFSIE